MRREIADSGSEELAAYLTQISTPCNMTCTNTSDKLNIRASTYPHTIRYAEHCILLFEQTRWPSG